MSFNDSGIKEITGVYVFANIDNKPVLAGRFKRNAGKGSFVYGKTYLSNPKAYAIDPINLPLMEKEFTTYANKGYFGVLLDAVPDQWGRKVFSKYYERAIDDEMKALIYCSGGGVGSLLFSLNQKKPIKNEVHKIQKNEFQIIDKTVKKIIKNEELNKEMIHLILDGSSLGGARPKISIEDNDHLWICKLNKDTDLINQAKMEHAFIQIANKLSINTVETKLETINGQDIVFIKRFDKEKDSVNHFISLNSLLNLEKVPVNEKSSNPYSYINFAQIVRKVSKEPEKDLDELYKRMLYNVLIKNTDDHAKNHGFLYDSKKRCYRLSPAYDMVPQTTDNIHSLIIGDYGRKGTIKNVLSAAPYFNKTKAEALLIVKAFQEQLPALIMEQMRLIDLKEDDLNIVFNKDMVTAMNYLALKDEVSLGKLC